MKNHFVLDPEVVYLNTGTLSLVPKPVMDTHIQELLAYEKNPTLSLFDGWERMWNVQKKVAQFFNARPEDFFFRHNVTGAMNDFLMGVRLEPGGTIATTNLEYGAITNICRYRCERDGRKLFTVQIPNENEITSADALVDSIVKQLPADTRMLMLSHVMTGTGLVIPLKPLAKILRGKNIVLAVDGAHAPGAFKLDLGELSDVHFYGGNLHKWMLGPKGTGFGWVPAWFQDQVDVVQAGWTTFETPVPFLAFGNESRFATRMLVSNCLSFPTFFTLEKLLNWWDEQGEQNIFNRLKFFRAELEGAARKNNWKILSSHIEDLKSPLLSLQVKKQYTQTPLQTMRNILKECGVQVAFTPWRGDFVLRLSAHIYSDEKIFEPVFKKLDFLKE